MKSVTLNQATGKLRELLNETVANHDETIISSDEGSVVLIELGDWEAIQETLGLLRDKKSLRALLNGHKARDNNEPVESVTPEEAFSDLQD